MRVDLPRDQWVIMRDLADLTGGDAKAVRRATRLKVSNGTLEEISMGLGDDQMDALLTRVITSWDVRAANGTPLGLPMIDKNALDAVPLDVYNLLVDAAQPLKDAIDGAGKASTGNGIVSPATSPPKTPTLQASVISQPEQSTTPSNTDGSPNDGTGLPPSPMSSPSSS